MSHILNIDTALDVATVCLASNGKSLGLLRNAQQKDHAAWLHPAIEAIAKDQGITLSQLDAVAVSIGPGSYTGLRVGLATAKGISYALNKPLIAVSTLELLASAVASEATDLICPLIDARRMEVFTAVYDKDLREILSPHTRILDANSFTEIGNEHEILFCGNGSGKLKPLVNAVRGQFSDTVADAAHLAQLSYMMYGAGRFSNLIGTEPLYIKDFFSPSTKE